MQKLFEAALGITSPWYVKEINFDVTNKRLHIEVDFEAGSTLKMKAKVQMEVLIRLVMQVQKNGSEYV